MNTYLIKSKIDKIRNCQQDFFEIYGRTIHPFTRKVFFYFHVDGGVKYVHKESLKFVYTNANTYGYDYDPTCCNVTPEYEVIDVIKFLEDYDGDLLPSRIGNNSKFIEYKYEGGESITDINEQEFFVLKTQHETTEYTPFYNSMAYNLVRNKNGIRLIDLKHFERKDSKSFFIYMHNEDIKLNRLYIEEIVEMDPIIKHLSIDYPINEAEIIKY